MSKKIYVGQKFETFKAYKEWPPYSRVTYWVDDERFFTAGDDTGSAMVLDNPWATQAMADKALEQIKGYIFRPYEATGVPLPPDAELGDAVTINGIYSVIGTIRRRCGPLGLCDISSGGLDAVDHEYPFKSPKQRELRRRMKLGQNYQGVNITRKDGLTVVEKREDGTEGAKAVLNSREFTFYDAGGGKVLFFDPVAGTYMFMGKLNVADNFTVDKDGNVVMKGGITLSGPIKWGTDNAPNKKRYAASISGPWHDTMQSGDIYCCDWDYVAETWGAAYQFKGQDGKPGSDASVPQWVKDMKTSYIDDQWMISPNIYGGRIMSETTIDVGTDATIGRVLRLKSQSEQPIGIVFNGNDLWDGPTIWTDRGSFMNVSAQHLNLIGGDGGGVVVSGQKLDISKVEEIDWGANAPVLRFT